MRIIAIAVAVSAVACSAAQGLEGAGGSGGSGSTTDSASSSAAGTGGATSSVSSSSSSSTGGGTGCPDAACLQPGDADTIINCDPTCGPVDTVCADVCNDSKVLMLSFGTTKVKAPQTALRDPRCACDTSSATLWALPVAFPAGTTCGGTFAYGGAIPSIAPLGSPQPLSCDSPTGGCETITEGSFAVLQQQAPGLGGVFTLFISNATPCTIAPCDTYGCNGTGGVWQ